jgi:uncharacterized cupin superfamily protein
MKVRMDDGTEVEGGPGDTAVIPPGHDTWVVRVEGFRQESMSGYFIRHYNFFTIIGLDN